MLPISSDKFLCREHIQDEIDAFKDMKDESLMGFNAILSVHN